AVTLTDNAVPVDQGTFQLNNAGYTRDLHPSVTTFIGGTHQLTASYGGDNSFSKSVSAVDKITITPALSQTQVYIPSFNLVGQSIQVQAAVTLPVLGGVAPTGTFTFNDGTAVLAGQVTTTAFAGGPFSY